MTCRFLSVLLALSVVACVTPMSMRQIEDVTTCRDTDLKQIRKNLLLAGYEIEEQTSEDLLTEWKQTSGYEKNKTLERITVVKVDPKTYRFKVMRRSISVEREEQARVSTTTFSNNQKQSESVGLSFGRDVERSNDYEPSYYVEHESRYRDKQYEVCGR